MKSQSRNYFTPLLLLALCSASFALVGCVGAPRFPANSTVNPDTSFNIDQVTINIFPEGSITSIFPESTATLSIANGDNTPNPAIDLSNAVIRLKTNTTYQLVVDTARSTSNIYFDNNSSDLDEEQNGQVTVRIDDAELVPSVTNAFAKHFLFCYDFNPSDIFSSVVSIDQDYSGAFGVDLDPPHPLGRSLRVRTSETARTGNMTVQLLRRASKNGLTIFYEIRINPTVTATSPLQASDALGTQIEDFKVTFPVIIED